MFCRRSSTMRLRQEWGWMGHEVQRGAMALHNRHMVHHNSALVCR